MFTCECLDCGHTMESAQHCNETKCPKCGGMMRRKDRPGPGQRSLLTVQRKLITAKSFSVNEEAFSLTAIISTKTVDRDGDIVEPRGVDLVNYKQNPVVLWAHDRQLPPIAKALEILVSDDTVMANVLFDKDDGFARMIFNKYAKGFLRTWSIGFGADEENVEPLTDGDGLITGLHFRQWELTEFSAVPVPANPEAVTRELAEMDLKSAVFFCKGYDAVPSAHKSSELMNLYTSFVEEKAFTARNHTDKVADNEPAWSRVKKDALPRVAYAWQAPGTKNKEQSTWSYPHHWVEDGGSPGEDGVFTTGKLYLHRGGLDAAWLTAMSARDGVRAPVEVVNHLQAHRKALGLEERHGYVQYTASGIEVYMVKDFEQVTEEEDVFIKSDKKLGETALKKSIEEAVQSGKVPVTVKLGEALDVEIDIVVVNETEEAITEAKVIGATVTVPKVSDLEALTPKKEPSRTDEQTGESTSEDTPPEKGADLESLRTIELMIMESVVKATTIAGE